MTEAICGPSNALQTFRKHTSVDRTLQQDRLALHRPTAESFRSAQLSYSNDVDNDFAAFQSQKLLGPPVQPKPFTPLDFHNAFAPRNSYAPATAAPPTKTAAGLPQWASDFQNQLHITSSISHRPSHEVSTAALQSRLSNSNSSWHHDFLSQSSSSSSSPIQRLNTNQMPFNNPQFWHQPSAVSPSIRPAETFQHPPLQHPILEEHTHDQAAFERAFDDVREHIQQLENETAALKTQSSRNEPATHSSHQEPRSQFTETRHILNKYSTAENVSQSQARNIASHMNPDFENDANVETTLDVQSQVEADAEAKAEAGTGAEAEAVAEAEAEADALAETAAKVLDSVADNTSQKFRQSAFLGLMRKLRDGEVFVKGDDIVDAVNGRNDGGSSEGGYFADSIGG